jgi:hypothetical protein
VICEHELGRTSYHGGLRPYHRPVLYHTGSNGYCVVHHPFGLGGPGSHRLRHPLRCAELRFQGAISRVRNGAGSKSPALDLKRRMKDAAVLLVVLDGISRASCCAWSLRGRAGSISERA